MQGTLNEQALGLIDAIRTAGGIESHVSRQAIAGAMGKPRLSASDTAVLDLLASALVFGVLFCFCFGFWLFFAFWISSSLLARKRI